MFVLVFMRTSAKWRKHVLCDNTHTQTRLLCIVRDVNVMHSKHMLYIFVGINNTSHDSPGMADRSSSCTNFNILCVLSKLDVSMGDDEHNIVLMII